MRGQHRAGYRAPRTGEKRSTRQPFKLDRLSLIVRDAILKARAEGRTWEETAEKASKIAQQPLSASAVHRWYDVRVAQVQREVMAQAERAREIAAAFAAKGFQNLPEAALNALSAEVFAVMEAKGGPERESSLGNLVIVLSKLMAAQAKQQSVELEKKKVELAEKKFKQLKAAAQRATDEAARKLRKGREITLDDINDIRQRTFGLPAIEQVAPARTPA
jgi:hypothetical protein